MACKDILQVIYSENFEDQRPNVLAVVDLNDQAEGLRYAREKGIFTTHDYKELYRLQDLDVIIELTKEDTLREKIEKTKPPKIRLIDHFEAMAFWDFLRVEEKKRDILKQIRNHRGDIGEIEDLFAHTCEYLSGIAEERNRYLQQIRKELVESERAMSQIVQGSTIPTFVINKDHIVTHWNKACERLTGLPAVETVGIKTQKVRFRSAERPIMADLILDQVGEEVLSNYYGSDWRKSALIEGAYEVEEFFPQLGEKGKWLFFTAAPIKSPDGTIVGAIETLWDKTADKKAQDERERHNKALAASERATSQIVDGSTIPTFVINKDHIVTHWNKALEKLSDITAEEMVGSSRQSVPFWGKKRPTMADVILDQIDEVEIQKLYGETWRKSSLIEGAYEAEAFFPKLGEKGKWCWFTAAPIRNPDGSMVGAIETLWDKTEDKKAEEDRERYTRELSTLCSIYGALNAPSDFEVRIKEAVQEVKYFVSADGISIYLLEKDGKFHLRYHQGLSKEAADKVSIADKTSTIYQVAQSNEYKILEDLPEGCVDETCFLEEEKLSSLAYIPISSKERGTLGVIRIGSKMPGHFSHREKNVLELIGNRIGVAIENVMLQEQYIKSEEKYRTLFNSDPHPIFILHRQTFEILDTNQRAQDSYGYSPDEFPGISFLKLGDEGDKEVSEGLENLSENHSMRFTKKRHYRKGGKPFYVNVSSSPA
ncbi:MAG: PAS domain S-box protein, partial [Desulfobacterales bacterium]|nr:PAS domain S-box protein [Desulfobacterales bacterium]